MVLTVRGDIVARVQAPDVSKQVEPKLAGIKDALPYGYRIETGGAIEESVKANGALIAVFPVMAVGNLGPLIVQRQSVSRPSPGFPTPPPAPIRPTRALPLSDPPLCLVAPPRPI